MANSRTEGMDLSTQILLIVGIMALLIILWMTLGHYIVNTAVLIAISLIRASNFLYELLPRFQVTDALFFFFVEEMFVKNTDIVIEAPYCSYCYLGELSCLQTIKTKSTEEKI